MKKAPIIAAAVVAALLGYCVLNDAFWPFKAPADWHPAWWQCRSLVGIGLLIMVPSGIAVSGIRDAGVGSERLLSVLFWVLVVISIAAPSAIFAGAVALIQRAACAQKNRANQSPEGTPGKVPSSTTEPDARRSSS